MQRHEVDREARGNVGVGRGSSGYVIVTPARDEARFIEGTIRSVLAQTVQPAKWVIVSDGSTDRTVEIVRQYAARHPWIELVSLPDRPNRSFASKAYAFRRGYERTQDVDCDAVVGLDADVSFDREYFAFLLAKLAEDRALGLVGTPFREGETTYDYRFVSIEHVSGACQVFRRECFEDIGGYVQSPVGGVDHIAVITARMKGWKTRTFTEKTCSHHRNIGSATRGVLMASVKVGALDYALGGHPVWEMCRTAYQMSRKPYVIGGLLVFAGYLLAALRRAERPISREVVEFRRREQMSRLRRFLGGETLGRQPSGGS